jgi:glutamyl-tRNA synthetase
VPVLVNEARKKLSKRRDKVAMEQYRDEGVVAPAMVNYLMTLGWAPSGDTEIVPFARICEEFRLGSVNHSSAFFDVTKLAAFNGEYLRAMSVEDFVDACGPWLAPPRATWDPARFDAATFRAMAPLVQTRVQMLGEVPGMVGFMFVELPELDEAAVATTFGAPWAAPLLGEVRGVLAACEWRADAIKSEVERAGERHGQKLGKAQAPLRVAVTGRTVGPPLFETLVVLGRDAALRRIDAMRERV